MECQSTKKKQKKTTAATRLIGKERLIMHNILYVIYFARSFPIFMLLVAVSPLLHLHLCASHLELRNGAENPKGLQAFTATIHQIRILGEYK